MGNQGLGIANFAAGSSFGALSNAAKVYYKISQMNQELRKEMIEACEKTIKNEYDSQISSALHEADSLKAAATGAEIGGFINVGMGVIGLGAFGCGVIGKTPFDQPNEELTDARAFEDALKNRQAPSVRFADGEQAAVGEENPVTEDDIKQKTTELSAAKNRLEELEEDNSEEGFGTRQLFDEESQESLEGALNNQKQKVDKLEKELEDMKGKFDEQQAKILNEPRITARIALWKGSPFKDGDVSNFTGADHKLNEDAVNHMSEEDRTHVLSNVQNRIKYLESKHASSVASHTQTLSQMAQNLGSGGSNVADGSFKMSQATAQQEARQFDAQANVLKTLEAQVAGVRDSAQQKANEELQTALQVAAMMGQYQNVMA